jgi:hypothetical protein
MFYTWQSIASCQIKAVDGLLTVYRPQTDGGGVLVKNTTPLLNMQEHRSFSPLLPPPCRGTTPCDLTPSPNTFSTHQSHPNSNQHSSSTEEQRNIQKDAFLAHQFDRHCQVCVLKTTLLRQSMLCAVLCQCNRVHFWPSWTFVSALIRIS